MFAELPRGRSQTVSTDKPLGSNPTTEIKLPSADLGRRWPICQDVRKTVVIWGFWN